MTWLKAVWKKLALEVFVTVGLWLVFYIAKKWLPKKWGVREEVLKKHLKLATVLIANLADQDDSITDVLEKSKNIMDFLQEEKSKAIGPAELFKQFMLNYEHCSVQYDDVFTSYILPQIGKYAVDRSVIMELDMMHGVMKYTFEHNGSNKNVFVIVNATDQENNSSFRYYATEKNFNPHALIELLFNEHDNKIFISAPMHDDGITIEPLNQNIESDYKKPEAVFADLVREIRVCKENGYQRSYILNGPPGTGKTSFCMEISRQISGKVLKIDSSFFNNLQASTCKKIIQALRVDFLIVDDIDRISFSDMPSFLYLLESIKTYSDKPTLLATVNDIRKLDLAVIRPGRFDDIIEFELPSSGERKTFIKNYCLDHSMKIEEEELVKIVQATEDLSHAYIKEFCLQFRIDRDADKVVEKIVKRKKYLDIVNDRLDEGDIEDEFEESTAVSLYAVDSHDDD